ncbi:MAG: nitroreductase family protein [Lentisphaeria bacterium]|nr:nitroreductase family protein [Lentisphaeria bacterium]NQZ70538.1 nitroreductase family protein [Lentisphaeria bacterium]
MDTFEAIESRRSIKLYDADHEMTDVEIDKLLSLAMLSPTAFNIQNTRFLIVRDPAIRQEIREASWDQEQVTDASLLIVLCADLKAWDKDPARYWEKAPQDIQELLVPTIGDYYADKDDVQRDEAMRSCGIAAQTLMLTAKAMGYDSCPMDGFDFEKVGEIVNLPEDHIISMFVVIGKGIQDAWERPGQLPMDEVCIQNSF